MELWDLYDENRNKINETHVRGEKIEEGKYHIVVDIWVVRPDGKILLTKRHPDKHYGLLWECTGGAITEGEHSKLGAVREVKEEIGLDDEEDELALIHTIKLSDYFVNSYIVCKDFELEDLVLQAEEVVDARFVTFEELFQLRERGELVPVKRFSLYKKEIYNFVENNKYKTINVR